MQLSHNRECNRGYIRRNEVRTCKYGELLSTRLATLHASPINCYFAAAKVKLVAAESALPSETPSPRSFTSRCELDRLSGRCSGVCLFSCWPQSITGVHRITGNLITKKFVEKRFDIKSRSFEYATMNHLKSNIKLPRR